ncbi:PH domain-containing protein [Hoyosella rhizosphaerae]|uniref:Low molecular weight protein antigen 6 PH domain-containing protein n=1 Tax=Hoyosella rhizosphaerae TaxID=1755582 RepID=A0A916UA69_9ACTN|nr:PH domain-containing protein [Hoyosella rhizosphaerae]GGC64252.1 hypothetical protein GCM10011410_15940 [Hoyosella rhizosphaerae]
MHNDPSYTQGGDSWEWSPQPAALWVAAIGGVILSYVTYIVRSEPAGSLLAGTAAFLLLFVAFCGYRATPRLAVLRPHPHHGPRIRFRSFLGRECVLEPRHVVEVRVLRYPRLGRRVPMLEIELNEPEDRLIILSRWDLGTEPDQVADILWSVGFTRRKY